jgi:hypothetical protein
VTGGAKDYNMKPKLLRAFRRGLLKVARTTGIEIEWFFFLDSSFCLDLEERVRSFCTENFEDLT